MGWEIRGEPEFGVSTTLRLESFTLSLRSFYHARITPMRPTLLWMALLTPVYRTQMPPSFHFFKHKHTHSSFFSKQCVSCSSNNHFLIIMFTVSISDAFRIHFIFICLENKLFLALMVCRLLLKLFFKLKFK